MLGERGPEGECQLFSVQWAKLEKTVTFRRHGWGQTHYITPEHRKLLDKWQFALSQVGGSNKWGRLSLRGASWQRDGIIFMTTVTVTLMG